MDCLAQTVDSGRSTRQSMDGPDPRFAQNRYIDRYTNIPRDVGPCADPPLVVHMHVIKTRLQ